MINAVNHTFDAVDEDGKRITAHQLCILHVNMNIVLQIKK